MKSLFSFPMRVCVIVDGNNHGVVGPEGKPRIFITGLDSAVVTLDWCNKLVNNIRTTTGYSPTKIEFDLSDYDLFMSWMQDEFSESDSHKIHAEYYANLPIQKTFEYNAKRNCLRIYKGGSPIYENLDGLICRDADALADCLM